MPMREFNWTTFVNGLRGQVVLYGRFESKKAILDVLNCSAYIFNQGASSNTLGQTGQFLVDIHGDNIVIATKTHFHAINMVNGKLIAKRAFTYWIQEGPGKWKKLRYEVK